MKTQVHKTTLTIAEMTIFRALSAAVLTETAANPAAIPTLKTPFFERAKTLGAGHRAAQVIAARVILRLEQRLEVIQAADKAKREAIQLRADLFSSVVLLIYNAQISYFQPVADETIRTALDAKGLRATKKVVEQVRATVLLEEIKKYVGRNYRTCTNGSESVSFGGAYVNQTEYVDWNLYRGKFKGWAAKIKDTEIHVSPDFARMPHRCIRDTLILETKTMQKAEKKGLPEGWSAYQVAYLAQGRGNDLYSAWGILVIDTKKSCLIQDTFSTALKVLQKQQ